MSLKNTKIKSLLKQSNINPNKKLGQNFIYDFNILNKIAKFSQPFKNYNIVEIGPGPGGLSKAILDLNPTSLILIEKDESFKSLLKELVNEYSHIKTKIIIKDFLKFDLSEISNKPFKIISNLPYYISTKMLMKLVPPPKNIRQMTLMFQKEVGERIIAKHCSKKYSRLSVICQSIFDIEKKTILPATVFYPKPKIDSIVLNFTVKEQTSLHSIKNLEKITRLAFTKRRKTIKNSLSSIENLKTLLESINVSENIRAEELSVKDYIKLANSLDPLVCNLSDKIG